MTSPATHKGCVSCKRPIPSESAQCPYCQATQPAVTTVGEILFFGTVGAVVVGAFLGLVMGWMLGTAGLSGWGEVWGLLTGQQGVGKRWAAAGAFYVVVGSCLFMAIASGIGFYRRVRKYLEDQTRSRRSF